MILVGFALADDGARAWEALYDARLVDAADGTPEVAAKFYAELLADLGPTDALRGPTNYWLGRALLEVGDLPGAVEALRAATVDETMVRAADTLRVQVELRERPVTALPVGWSFDEGAGGFVRGASGRGKGELSVRRVDGAVLLSWETFVRAAEDDALLVAMAEDLRPQSIRFRARSSEFAAVLRVVATDGSGGRYAAPAVQVPVEEWVDVAVPVSSLEAIEPGTPRLARVHTLGIEDLTGIIASDRGVNTLLIDDVEIR